MRHATTICAATACLFAAAIVSPLQLASGAELSPDNPILAAIRAANENFRPVTSSKLAERKAEVDAVLARLDGFLAFDKDAASGWHNYLRSQELRRELGRAIDANPAALNELAARYSSGQEGLELPQFTAVRGPLERYIAALTLARIPDQTAWLDGESGKLAELLTGYTKAPSSAGAEQIAMLLNELSAAAPAAAQNVRRSIDQPNLLIQTSADFFSTISSEDIDENDPHFTDNILGTSISGTTHTVGTRTAVLIDSPDRGLMEIQLRGTTTSQTVGLHSPVTIHSSGTTQFTGALRVAMDPEGFIASCPAAWACTHTNINGLCICGGRLVQRIATKRVYQSKSEAEGIAAGHAEQRVKDRIKSNATEGLAKQNQGYQDKLIKPLARWGAVPDLHYSSTPAALFITARESGSDQLAAPGGPPAIDGNPMLGIRVHESFINNMTAKTLGGRRITREEFVKGYKDIFMEDPPGEKADEEHDKHWTITFAKEQPVNIHFADNGFSIALNATRFTSTNPDTDIDYPWTISADYKIDGRQAKRIGEIKVEAKGGKPTQRAVDRGKLLHRFENMFKETFEFHGLEFQKAPFSKAGKLVSSQLSSEQGWLTVGWNK